MNTLKNKVHLVGNLGFDPEVREIAKGRKVARLSLLETGSSLFRLVHQLIAFRHRYPILRRNLFLTGKPAEDSDVRDVTWINAWRADGGAALD